MSLGTLDLSMWPPALVFALVVIYLICKVLPDWLDLSHPAHQPAAATQASAPVASAVASTL